MRAPSEDLQKRIRAMSALRRDCHYCMCGSSLYVRFIVPKRVVQHRGVRCMNILDQDGGCRSIGRGRAFPLRVVQR
jgi:hypothetical protein